MDPLSIGQPVTYVATDGSRHPATVVEPYLHGALVHCDLGNVAVRRLRFDPSLQIPPYITDDIAPAEPQPAARTRSRSTAPAPADAEVTPGQ